MSKPNFQAMRAKNLHDYVLRDQEAFYAYVDKLHAEANWIEMPPLETVGDLDKYQGFIEHLHKSAQLQDKNIS